jgi:hypothetical protein
VARALLLRPHDFLVDEMRGWLSSLGLSPERFSTLDDLARSARADVACLVVSIAVTSEVKASVADAVEAGRRFAPGAPLLLAGLSRLESARQGLAPDLQRLRLAVHGPGDAAAAWGSPGVALYVSADDLKEPRRAALTATARMHLKLP